MNQSTVTGEVLGCFHSFIGQGMKPPKAQSACVGQHPYTETSPSIDCVVMYALYVLVYVCEIV